MNFDKSELSFCGLLIGGGFSWRLRGWGACYKASAGWEYLREVSEKTEGKSFLVAIKMDTKLCLLLFLSAHLFAGKIIYIFFLYYTFALSICAIHIFPFYYYSYLANSPIFLIFHPIVILICIIIFFCYSNALSYESF